MTDNRMTAIVDHIREHHPTYGFRASPSAFNQWDFEMEIYSFGLRVGKIHVNPRDRVEEIIPKIDSLIEVYIKANQEYKQGQRIDGKKSQST